MGESGLGFQREAGHPTSQGLGDRLLLNFQTRWAQTISAVSGVLLMLSAGLSLRLGGDYSALYMCASVVVFAAFCLAHVGRGALTMGITVSCLIGLLVLAHAVDAGADLALFYLLPVALFTLPVLRVRAAVVVGLGSLAGLGVARVLQGDWASEDINHSVDMVLVFVVGWAAALASRWRLEAEIRVKDQAYVELDQARAQNVELRERAEREAVRANASSESKSRFLANMSHELRTPLNAILGYADLIAEDPTDAGVPSDLANVTQAGRHLLSLINGVLDLAKVESGEMDLVISRFSVAELVREVGATVGPLVQKRANTLIIECADVEVESDRRLLQQILLNLVGNAAKFTEGGVVKLEVKPDVDGALVTVADTGEGMCPDTLSRVFLPFQQATTETATLHGGTGLGLALVARYCDELGIALRPSSVPGQGSQFELRLPLNASVPFDPVRRGRRADCLGGPQPGATPPANHGM